MDDDGTDRGKKYFESINKEYDNLRKKFKKRMTRRHLEFDEDVFHDILMKCANKFPDTDVRDIEGYIWTAYKRDCIRNVKKSLHFDTIDTGNPLEIPDEDVDMDVNELEGALSMDADSEMQVSLVNDGPVTIVMDTDEWK